MFQFKPADWRKRYPQLASITDPAWITAAEQMYPITIPAGTHVYHPGDQCRNFVLLLEGNIRIYASSRYGREIVLYRMQPGEFCILTLVTLLRKQSYPANSVTENEVHAMIMERPVFDRVFNESPVFREYMIQDLSKRFLSVIEQLQELAFEPLEIRLADLLFKRFRDDNALQITMTHSQVAQELGTSREVASRMLKELERRNVLKLKRGSIQINDWSSLHRLEELTMLGH